MNKMIDLRKGDSLKRRCNVCLETKELNCFYKDISRPLQKSYTCKKCKNEKTKKYQSSLNPEVILERDLLDNKARRKRYYQKYKETSIREYAYKTRYGISIQKYNELFEKQKGLCLICQTKGYRRLVVDHCHTTNKVRGLLCDNCNRGLGSFKDNIFSLKNAIKYLEDNNDGK